MIFVLVALRAFDFDTADCRSSGVFTKKKLYGLQNNICLLHNVWCMMSAEIRWSIWHLSSLHVSEDTLYEASLILPWSKLLLLKQNWKLRLKNIGMIIKSQHIHCYIWEPLCKQRYNIMLSIFFRNMLLPAIHSHICCNTLLKFSTSVTLII